MKGLVRILLAGAGIGLVLHNLPYLVRDQAVLWLKGQGVEQVQLTALDVNWLTGQITLRGLRMASAGQAPLELQKLNLDLDYAALTDRQIRLSDFTVAGLHGRYADTPHGRWLGPLALDPLLSSAESPAPEPAEVPDNGPAWQFGLDAVHLTDIRWSTELGSDTYPVVIDSLVLSPLRTWKPQVSSDLTASGTLLGADFSLQLTANPLADSRTGDLSLTLNGLPLQALPHPGMQTLQGRLSADLKTRFSYAADGSLDLQPQGQLELQDGRVRLNDIQARLQAFNWQGQLSLKYAAEQLALNHNGQISLAGLNAAQGTQTLKLTQLNLDGDTRWQGMATGQLSHNGRLQLAGVEAQAGADQAQLDKFSWQGDSQLQLTGGTPQIKQQGRVKLSGVQISRLPQLRAELASVNVPLSWQFSDKLSATLADLQLAGLKVESPEQSYTLAQLSGAGLGKLQLKGEALSLEALRLDQLAVGESGQNAMASVDQLLLTGLKADAQRADIGALGIRGSRTYLVRGTQGEMQDIERLQRVLATLAGGSGDSQPAEAAAVKQQQAQAYRWKLERIDMGGQNRILFADRSVAPHFDAEMEVEKLAVGRLDNQSAQATPFELKGVLNRFGTLALEGEVTAFSQPLSGRWQASVLNAELPPLSPYSIPLLGYFLRSGQLSVTSHGTITAGDLDGNTEIRLANVTVRPEARDKVAQVTQRLSMPLETAIALLSDSRDNIKLDVPVRGSLENPEFGYQSIIQRIAEKGVKQAAFSFLTQALQPYGTLISLARTAATSDLQTAFIRLSPITFAAGEAGLSAEADDYLSKMSDMLLEKKGLRLNICGVATPEDRALFAPEVAKQAAKEKMDAALQAQTLEARLRTLAGLRAETVKERLQQTIPADRLFTCYAKVLSEPEGELRGPRVELAL